LLHGVGRHFVNVGLAVLAGLSGVLTLILSLLLILTPLLLILILVPVVSLGDGEAGNAEHQRRDGDRETSARYEPAHFNAPSVGPTDRMCNNSARSLEYRRQPKKSDASSD
jgi:hypothetical protein